MTDCIILGGDCRRTLAAIRSDSIDLVVSSPPYGNQKTYGTTLEKRLSLEDYLEDMRPVLSELCWILRPTGSLCWQVGNHIEDEEVRDHSQKPDEFYRLVETLCPGRKIELFSRENRDGWDTWLSQAGDSQTARM